MNGSARSQVLLILGAGFALAIGSQGRQLGWSLILILLAGGRMVWILQQLWKNPRQWYQVRYHALTPPDPVALQAALQQCTKRGTLVVRWLRTSQGLELWLEIPQPQAMELRDHLATILTDVRLEPQPAPKLPIGVAARLPLAQFKPKRTHKPADPATEITTTPIWRWIRNGREVRLILFSEDSAALLYLGYPARDRIPAPLRPLAVLPKIAAGSQGGWRMRLFTQYPWGEKWPSDSTNLPAFGWPATANPETQILDSHAAYDLAPSAPPVDSAVPALILGISTTADTPLQVPILTPTDDSTLWAGHFLSLGTGAARYAPLQLLAQQAYDEDRAVFVLDAANTLLPTVEDLLLDRAIRPAWITRQHPRSSLRFNLLTVPALPSWGPDAEWIALDSAVEVALPLFETFLTRLGIAPWSTSSGGILLHHLALLRLLAHHRTRLTQGAALPVPTLGSLYGDLSSIGDLRPLLDIEYQAWCAFEQNIPDRQWTLAAPIIDKVHDALNEGRAYWGDLTVSEQREAANSLKALLHPVAEVSGFAPLWRGTMAPSAYFNERPAPLTLTQLLPPNPTERDHILAGWYRDYLLLALRAAAHMREVELSASPPLLVLMEDLQATTEVLPSSVLAEWGRNDISCAAAETQLPPAPYGGEVLQSRATWWLHRLQRSDAGALRSHLTAIRPEAGVLALAQFPEDRAVLRTVIPIPQVATVYLRPARQVSRQEQAA